MSINKLILAVEDLNNNVPLLKIIEDYDLDYADQIEMMCLKMECEQC
jgi:hypothetical protein